jgi:hypothetical protein
VTMGVLSAAKTAGRLGFLMADKLADRTEDTLDSK